jgi:uncharacterized protein Veg
MPTKLTLTIDEAVIMKAKKYAKKKENSLSNIIENYLKVLVVETPNTDDDLSPIVKSMKSSFSVSPDFDYKKELAKRLSDKYL